MAVNGGVLELIPEFRGKEGRTWMAAKQQAFHLLRDRLTNFK